MKELLQDLQFKAIGVFTSKASKDGRRLIRGHASTGDLDRQGEVITLGALIGARQDLLKNSTVFLNHKHSELPVGKVIDADIDESGLVVTVEFTKAEFADDLWKLIEEGIMNRFSIGGMVKEAVEKQDKITGDYFVEITKIELYEVSIVGLPANEQAKFELVSKSFNMAISEEIKKREAKPTMANETKKEDVKEVEEIGTDSKVATDVVEKEVEKKEEVIEKEDVVEKEEVVEKADDSLVKEEELVEKEVVEKEEEVIEKKEEVVEVEKEEVVEKEETSLEDSEKPEEEVVEKSTDEKILETLALILQHVSKEEVVEKKEEAEEETVEEIVEKAVEEEAEEVEEKPEETVEEEVEEEVVEKAVEEVEVEKVVEEEEEEEVDIDSLRKGEVVIAETPYSNEKEEKTELSTSEIKKLKEIAWTKMIFGRK